MRILSFGVTDVGKKRLNNEDALAIKPELQLYLVADGMGGHSSGEVASRLAIQEIVGFFESSTLSEDSTWPYTFDDGLSFSANQLRTAIALANQKIQGYAAGHPESRGMGTTIVAALVAGGTSAISHVGDSRAYLLREGTLKPLTADHSWVGEQVSKGFLTPKEAVNHPFRNVITKALGTKEQAPADVQEIDLSDGDRILLCSDGLNTMVDDETIREVLAGHTSLEGACTELVKRANENGGEDNITVVLLEARE